MGLSSKNGLKRSKTKPITGAMLTFLENLFTD